MWTRKNALRASFEILVFLAAFAAGPASAGADANPAQGVEQQAAEIAKQTEELPDEERWYTPDFLMLQSAGYVGYVAAGFGWHPGFRHEFATLVGYVPESIGGVEIWAFTLKYTWHPIRPVVFRDSYWTPVTAGLSVIRGWHRNLWVRQPEQYPDNYYNPSALHATFNVGTSLRLGTLEVFLEFAALDRGLAAYLENREFFQEHYAYWGLEGIGSMAIGVKREWP